MSDPGKAWQDKKVFPDVARASRSERDVRGTAGQYQHCQAVPGTSRSERDVRGPT